MKRRLSIGTRYAPPDEITLSTGKVLRIAEKPVVYHDKAARRMLRQAGLQASSRIGNKLRTARKRRTT